LRLRLRLREQKDMWLNEAAFNSFLIVGAVANLG
jgi:hypothetical protein